MTFSDAALRRFVCSRFFVDYGHSPSDAVVVAGHARSGTTWVANILNSQNDYRMMFEPFSLKHVPECRHFGRERYIRPDSEAGEFLKPVERILRGKIRNRWIDSHNRRCVAHARLIKTIRANFFLKWLRVHFPEVPIILVMRHPGAVISSVMQQGWWKPGAALPNLMRQLELVEDFLTPFTDLIHRTQDHFEQLMICWCIEHYVLLKQFHAGEIYPVLYEHLCQSPERQIHGLFTYLNRPYRLERVMKSVQNPSLTARKNRQEILQGKPLHAWRQYLATQQIHRCVELLSLFGLDRIYTDAPVPDESGLAERLLTS